MSKKSRSSAAGAPSRYAIVPFIVLSLVNVVALLFHDRTVASAVKPFLMPSLAVASLLLIRDLTGWKGASRRVAGLLLAALCLHTLGDILLIPDGTGFFLGGLASFGAGHIFYLMIFASSLKALKGLWKVLSPVLMLALLAFLLHLVGVGGLMAVPVALYASLLLTMILCGACAFAGRERRAPFILFGAVLFAFSDSLIALGTFAGISFKYVSFTIMLTYLVAQWLLSRAAVITALEAVPRDAA